MLEAAAGSRDLLVSAQTGSGKTVAYGLAMASMLIGEADHLPPPAAPLALVIAPTRELALQVQRELSLALRPRRWPGRGLRRRHGSAPGESRMLAEGTHIVVGTPGRLRDHLERRNLDPTALRAVILDEADEMLDLGFREDIEFILSATPPEQATYLFSATLPKAIETLAERYQRGALRLAIKGETKGHADIAYRAVRIMPRRPSTWCSTSCARPTPRPRSSSATPVTPSGTSRPA
ncbi:DEAD/DEAH box helicase [Methylobacterium oryzae CBMB20]